MRMRGRRFEVDRAEGKLFGVCAGLANYTGVDATIVRVAVVLVTLMGAFPWTLVAYGIAAFAGQPRHGSAAGHGRLAGRGRNRPRRDQRGAFPPGDGADSSH